MKAVLVFLFLVSKAFSEDCVLDVSDSESPFIVYDNMTFPTFDKNASPTANQTANQTFTFPTGTPFFVVCPKGTQSPYLGESGSEVACTSGTQLINLENLDKPLDFVNIKCRPSKVATVATANETCAGTGVLYSIGFNVTDEFLTLITICFDQDKLTPFYVKYNKTYNETSRRVLDADTFYETYICNGTECDWTDSGRVYNDVDIENAYDNQTAVLESAGVENVTLVRLPLTLTSLLYLNVANDSQEIQKIPYYDYINVVPIWNTPLIDILFYVFDTKIPTDQVGPLVWTGTLGVAATDKASEIYLSDNKVPVPKWLWMALDKTEKILFYYNSADLNESSNDKIDDICTNHMLETLNMYSCIYDDITDDQMTKIVADLKAAESSS